MNKLHLSILICSLFFFCQLNGQAIKKGLVAYYPFSLGKVTDNSVKGNDGFIKGTVKPVADRFGNACSAMQFDGNGYISVPSSPSLRSPTTALTITGWFKLERDSKDDRTQLLWVTMVCKSNNSNESDNSPQYRLQLTEKTVSLNTDFTEAANQRWQLNKWYHTALVYSGSMVKAYLNGEQFFSYPYFGQLSSTNADLEIGRDVPGNPELFVGQLDDIYIFNRALSENEIRQIYTDQSNKNLTYDPCSGVPTLADSKPLPPTPPRSRNRTPNTETERSIPEEEPKFSPYPGNDTPSSEKEITNFEVEGPYEGMTGQPMIWEGDTVYFQETVTVKNSNITIYPYDHQREDGDIISLNINGVWLLDNYTIRNKGKDVKRASLSLLPEKENYLISKAWNLGKVPPNTLTLEIDDGSQNPKIITINSEIGKSGAIKIIYKPEK